MTIILCLDNRNGLMFNNRRLSRDENVIRDIIELLNGQKLYCLEYSRSLFQHYGFEEHLYVMESIYTNMSDTIWFIENVDFDIHLFPVSCFIVYYWNRIYPADTVLDQSILEGYKLLSSKDFSGTSHENITKKIYVKV